MACTAPAMFKGYHRVVEATGSGTRYVPNGITASN